MTQRSQRAQRPQRKTERAVGDTFRAKPRYNEYLELNLEPTDISGLVTAARERFQPTALQQRIALDMSVDQNLANVRADPDRLVQVLDNLIFNALKFTPEGGRVGLRVERRADYLLVSISDSGDGIACPTE